MDARLLCGENGERSRSDDSRGGARRSASKNRKIFESGAGDSSGRINGAGKEGSSTGAAQRIFKTAIPPGEEIARAFPSRYHCCSRDGVDQTWLGTGGSAGG